MFSPPATAQPSAPEVRWCAKCHQTAVVEVGRWGHTSHRIATGQTTRDFRCQHCGKRYRIRPRLQTTLGMFIGVMAATTIIGLPIFFVYWRRFTEHKRIPPVAGAPMPAIRFADGPPLRRCPGCAAPARATNITATRINGIPAGTEYVHRCDACSREFTIQSVWGIVLGALMGLLVAAGAAAFLAWAETPGWFWGGSIVCGLIALALVGQSIAQWRARGLHPIVGAKV